MSNPDDKGQADIPADTQGEGKIRLDGSYLAEALRACGGMVELKLVNAQSPMLFTTNGYSLVIMPMFAGGSQKPKADTQTAEPVKVEASQAAETEAETTEKAEAVAEAKTKTEAEAVAEAQAEAVAEAVTQSEAGKSRSRKRELVTA